MQYLSTIAKSILSTQFQSRSQKNKHIFKALDHIPFKFERRKSFNSMDFTMETNLIMF